MATSPVLPWDIYDDSGDSFKTGVDDLHRGITYEAQGDKQMATEYYRRALSKDPGNQEAKTRLAAVNVAEARP
jgi:Tfp pilus assembly protein PilF